MLHQLALYRRRLFAWQLTILGTKRRKEGGMINRFVERLTRPEIEEMIDRFIDRCCIVLLVMCCIGGLVLAIKQFI